MKRSAIIILTLSLLLPLVSAVDINLNPQFKPGETMIASIEANILTPIKIQDVYFYSGREQIPIIFDVARIQDKNYIYAQLPLTERNYTLFIKSLHFYENGLEQTQDIKKDFQVIGNVTDFSVSPGFIISTGDFSITVESKNKKLSLETKFLDNTQIIEVPAGQKKKISFSTDLKNFTITQLEISALGTKYSLPVAIIPKAVKEQYENNVTEAKKFRFNKEDYVFEVRKNEERKFSIYLQNFGDIQIDNVKIFVSNDLKDLIDINPEELDLESGDSNKTILTILIDETGEFNGKIYADSENFSTSSDINIISRGVNEPIANNTVEEEFCVLKNGVECLDNQNCDGNLVDSFEGKQKCCIGTCVEKKSYTGIIIGIILILAVAAGIVFFYLKTKKKPATPEEIIKQRVSSFKYGEVKNSS